MGTVAQAAPPESWYDRTVADAPTRRQAESELREREQRRDELDVKPLDPGARTR